MGSNQQQQSRYTGIQSQISQGSPSIGVAQYQQADMSGVMKTIGAIENHINQTQDANRQVDYTVLGENLKAQEAQDAQVLNTIDPKGYVTIQGEEPMLYSDYIKRSTETKQGYLTGFQNTWSRKRNDAIDVSTRSMLELLPLDQQKAMKTAELNLAHIQLGENLAKVASNPNIGLDLKLKTARNAVKLASMPEDERNKSLFRFGTVAIQNTLTEHQQFVAGIEAEALKMSQGSQELYQSTMDTFYKSDKYLSHLKDLNTALDIAQEMPALIQTSIVAQQGLTAEGQQKEAESIQAKAKQMQSIYATQAKMALQAGGSATSFALGGGYDSESVSQSMAVLSKVINNPYVPKETKMLAEQQVKQLVEAKKLGVQLQKNPLGIDVSKIKDPELGAMVLTAQERFKAKQEAIAEKQQKQQDKAIQDYYNASVLMQDGYTPDSVKKNNANWQQISDDNGALRYSKEVTDKKVIEGVDNLEGVARDLNVKSGTVGETAFLASVGRVVGIEDQQTLHAMIQLADTRQQGLEYLKLNRVIQNLDDKFGEDKKKLLQGHIDTYSKDKKNVLLFQSTHLLKPQVFTNLVIAKTITEIGEKGVFDKDGNPSLAFKTKFAENYTALGKQFVSNAKRIVNNNFAVQTAIRTNNYVPIYKPKNVYIEPADHTDWNHQPVPVSALVGKFSWYGEKTGAGTFKLTSAYRHTRTSKRTQHSGDVKGEFALDFADNGNDRQTQLQFFSIISGISDISKDVQMTGHGSMMYNYAKMAKSGKYLNYLTPQQNASLQKRLKKVKMLQDEGASAENHFHVRAIPIEESVLRAVPASTKARLTNR
jgi:hypothetical protein